MLRGVNLCGAEFGETALPGIPGTNYTWNSEASFRYFGAKGLGLIRIPVLWERLQPEAYGPLESEYLAGLRANLDWAAASVCRVIIDVQNFGRYYGRVAGPETLADLWVRLVLAFGDHPALYGWGLMNEPHDTGATRWMEASQAVVTAIRATGDTTLILVPGEAWSSARRWPDVHGAQAWIRDPADNFAYEAHQYFDRDGSGRYRRTYEDELARDPALALRGPERLSPFVAWCRANGVRGYLGEYGVPDTDIRWYGVLDLFLSALDDAGFDGTYWAAGEWWGAYPLSVQPAGGFDRPQMAVLEAHLGL
ncbi:MAG TPA: cellulase family glycosylhydrolase [Bryobacteraceae bacterium]|nr:cellulase family glycosylhydrolase [Bryobacteraceae bacterium]